MKSSFLLFLFFLNITAYCQNEDTYGINITDNDRLDTVTVYNFTNRTILTTQISEAKKESNYSLKGKGFRLFWLPVCNRTKEDIQSFANRCVRDKKNVSDTLYITVFGNEYRCYVMKIKSNYFIFMYCPELLVQDVFYAKLKKKTVIPDLLKFFAENFK